MRAMVKLAAAVGDTTGLSVNCTISAALCSKTMNDTLWTGTHWRAAAGESWSHGDAIMSGALLWRTISFVLEFCTGLAAD